MTNRPKGMRKGLTRYGDEAFSLFLRKSFIKAMSYTDSALERPIVGVTNTFSGYNACHGTVPDLVEAVKRGVMLAGGLPVEFPTVSLHESFAYPTSMFLRNLMAMDVEEMIRAQPMDAVVLIGGCDKKKGVGDKWESLKKKGVGDKWESLRFSFVTDPYLPFGVWNEVAGIVRAM